MKTNNATVSTSIEVQKYLDVGKGSRIKIGIWGPRLSDWRDLIEDYIYLLRKRVDNKMSMFQQQLTLLENIAQTQQNIKMLKDITKHPEHMSKYTKDVEQINNPDMESAAHQLNDNNLLLGAFLDVGDGHLWRLFNFNRPLLYVLGTHMDAGPMKYDAGFLNELAGWSKSVLDRDVSHFIINSITNYGRVGDVIVRNINGDINIKEIKSNKSTRGKQRQLRLKRQEKVRENFISFANYNEGIIGGKKIKILLSKIPLNTSLKSLGGLLERSSVSGIEYGKLTPFINVVCSDMNTYMKKWTNEDKAKSLIDRAFDDWPKKSENIISYSFSERRTYSPNLTPVSIYPFSPEIVADLLLGKKEIHYFLNIDVLVDKFEKNKWQVVSILDNPPTNPSADRPFCVLTKGNLTVGLPWTLTNLLMFDLADIKSIIKVLDKLNRDKIPGEGRYLVGFDSESKVWL